VALLLVRVLKLEDFWQAVKRATVLDNPTKCENSEKLIKTQ
jgi:hypothetical protein